MRISRHLPVILTILLPTAGVALMLALRNIAGPGSYAELKTALETTTQTLGALLGIIAAGLMFTQGKFGEITSELANMSPHYLTDILSLEKTQSLAKRLLDLRRKFTQLAKETAVPEERSLYERVVEKASSILVDFTVLLHLKFKMQGLSQIRLLTSEMDPDLYRIYEERKRTIRSEWQVFELLQHVLDIWEGPTAFFTDELQSRSTLQFDLTQSVSILDLKSSVDKNSATSKTEAEQSLDDLGVEISRIGKKLHEDRVSQLLYQMKQSMTLRGRYFHLTVALIAAPLLANLLILPQLSETSATLFEQVILATSATSVVGVAFLLLYVYKILNA